MVTIVIHGEAVKSEADLHRHLASQLDFGQYYSANLDALFDRLSTDVERPVRLVWENAAESRQCMGTDLFEKILKVLRAVEAEDIRIGYKNRFTVTLRE